MYGVNLCSRLQDVDRRCGMQRKHSMRDARPPFTARRAVTKLYTWNAGRSESFEEVA